MRTLRPFQLAALMAVLAGILATLVAGCTPASTPTATPTTTPRQLPSPTPTATPGTSPEAAGAAQMESRELVEALRRGGYVIYFRHAATDFSQPNTGQGPEWWRSCDPRVVRQLNEAGRAQARSIGQAFTTLGIPVGEVLSSEFCRCAETARLAFGRVALAPDLSSFGTAEDEAEQQRRAEALRRLLSTPPPPKTNTVLVGHLFNIQAAAEVSLPEGGAAVFRPAGPEGFLLVGKVGPEEWTALAQELAVPTPSQPTLQEYPVPPGSHPHDVAPAPDGWVWYTAQASVELGKLDPSTGETHHIKLGEGSRPHGVIVGPDGSPWITDGGLNALVRVDPATEEVQVFPLPQGSGYANLNTATFDSQGVLWFTGQSGIYGRLDPRTGQVEVFQAPGGRGPYGITTTPSGEVYYASLAGSHIARIDTATGQATVIQPPTAGQGARRVWSDSQGRLWVSEWNAGQLGMLDPASGQWREWRLPGQHPMPYAVYVDDQDMVWLSDFGANALVRFDPATEQFQSFPLPSAGAAVRQILGRPGEVWGAESGTDKLVVIRTR